MIQVLHILFLGAYNDPKGYYRSYDAIEGSAVKKGKNVAADYAKQMCRGEIENEGQLITKVRFHYKYDLEILNKEGQKVILFYKRTTEFLSTPGKQDCRSLAQARLLLISKKAIIFSLTKILKGGG